SLLTRSARHGSVDPSVAANTPATDAAGLEEVRNKGFYILEKLTSTTSVLDGDEAPPHTEFMRLPSRIEYPSYYEQIKKPISFHEIRQKIDKAEYTTIAEVRSDFNQCFVNAKRFNAPGSGVFLNAKHLHKLLKTTYAILTGDLAMPEEDDGPETAMSPGPSSVPTLQPKAQHISVVANPSVAFAKRGPTLKPWLTKKLNETMDLKDISGRAYADGFRTLPDRKLWPQYYSVITHPMCIDTIQTKISKRYYANVKQFIDDVDVMLANALFFNEEASRIWKDARMIQNHFAEVMKEVPPVFVPPRKYNTAKRRAEQEAAAAGLPMPADGKNNRPRSLVGGSEPPEGRSPGFDDAESGDDDDGGYNSGNGSSVLSPAPYTTSLPVQGPFTLPLRTGLITPNGLAPTVAALPAIAPHIKTSGSPPLQPYNASSQLVPPPGAFSQSPNVFSNIISNQLSPRLNGNLTGNGLHSPLIAPHRTPPGDPPKRLIAKLPRRGDVPAISRFLVRNTPATVPITLDNTLVRQHSISVTASTERVDFTPFFRRATSTLDKGKGKDSTYGAVPESTPFLNSFIKISVRPATTKFESLAELPSPDGPTHRYSLTPKPGLTVVEFTVTPRAGALPGDNQTEIYRVFVTK
ncbi:hypothetical protein P7C70_g1727, partial [Phenoliferia sp. Uapishka_3]